MHFKRKMMMSKENSDSSRNNLSESRVKTGSFSASNKRPATFPVSEDVDNNDGDNSDDDFDSFDDKKKKPKPKKSKSNRSSAIRIPWSESQQTTLLKLVIRRA
jgi:hypothetical protein